VPADCRHGVIIPLYKWKGTKWIAPATGQYCFFWFSGRFLYWSYYSASNHWSLRRVVQSSLPSPQVDPLQMLSQCYVCFRKLITNSSAPLHVAYIDLNLAFNNMDRSAQWLALKTVGTPDILLQLLQDLHIGSGTRVMVGGECLRQILHDLGDAPGICVGIRPVLSCGWLDNGHEASQWVLAGSQI